MKSGKSGPEKYYRFLLPNNRGIQVGPQYLTTYGKMIESKNNWTTRK